MIFFPCFSQKSRKVVVLEDLAAEFGIRTQDVVSRVLALEQMGHISGVIDDRGKFIYITPEEMKKVSVIHGYLQLLAELLFIYDK